MGKLYVEKQIDEVQLGIAAKSHVDSLNGALPSTEHLLDLTNEFDIDLATMVFYQSILASPIYSPFIKCVDEEEAAPLALDSNIKILVLPAFYYKEHPEVGGDGEIIVNIANACGIEAEVIPTKSLGSVSISADLIDNWISKQEKKNIWFVTLSKGGAELRYFIQHSRSEKAMQKVHGWINIGNIANGSKLVDHMYSTPARKLKTRAITLGVGVNYKGLQEMKTDHPLWKKPCQYPEHLKIINIVAAPLRCHVQRTLMPRYLRLQQYGPNDGMVLLKDSLILSGEIYPMWGADHFFRNYQISPLLYKLFRILMKENTN